MRLMQASEVDENTHNALTLVDGYGVMPAGTPLQILRRAPGGMKLCKVLVGPAAGAEVTLPGAVRVLV